MRLLDVTTKKFDLWIEYQLGFGFHVSYSGGYMKGISLLFMGLEIYVTIGSIEDFND